MIPQIKEEIVENGSKVREENRIYQVVKRSLERVSSVISK
jgi:hypothetical protein